MGRPSSHDEGTTVTLRGILRLAAFTLAVCAVCVTLIVGYAPAANAATAFDNYPTTVTFQPRDGAPSDAWNVTVKIGSPGWDGRIIPKADGSKSPYSYGYVYPINLTDNGGGSRGPGLSLTAYRPDGSRDYSADGDPLTRGALPQSVPSPWPAVCKGYDLCYSPNLALPIADHDPLYESKYSYQIKALYDSTRYSTRYDIVQPLPGAESVETPPAGLPDGAADPGEGDPEPEDPSGGTSRCFPEGFTWDIGGMLGGVVKCLFVPSDEFMDDLTSKFDSIGPTKLPVVLMGTINSWHFNVPDGSGIDAYNYCSGFSVNFSQIHMIDGHAMFPDFRILNACAGEPLRPLADITRVLVGIGALIGAFLSIRRSVGGIVQYNTGGDDE